MRRAAEQRCPFCHASFEAGEKTWACRRCGTRHHSECADENAQCTVLGCGRRFRLPGTRALVVAVVVFLLVAAGFGRDAYRRARANRTGELRARLAQLMAIDEICVTIRDLEADPQATDGKAERLVRLTASAVERCREAMNRGDPDATRAEIRRGVLDRCSASTHRDAVLAIALEEQ